jgi:hypothetical protein
VATEKKQFCQSCSNLFVLVHFIINTEPFLKLSSSLRFRIQNLFPDPGDHLITYRPDADTEHCFFTLILTLQKCFRTYANAGVLEIVTCCKQILLLLDKTESKLEKAKEIFNFLCDHHTWNPYPEPDQYPDLDSLHGKVPDSEPHRDRCGHETLCIGLITVQRQTVKRTMDIDQQS